MFKPVSTEPLFEDRTPEAAARQLAVVLAWATECELATVEYYRATKSTSRGELRRHESIAEQLVFHCRDLKVPPYGLMGIKTSRLAELLRNDSK